LVEIDKEMTKLSWVRKKCISYEGFRKDMMWNFFVMFFYEACLEICMSIVVGV